MVTAITIVLHFLALMFVYSAGVNKERKNLDAAAMGAVLTAILFVMGVAIRRLF